MNHPVGSSRVSDKTGGVVVVGAGIVGVSTAIWLQRSGFSVTLIDREGVAAGTSFGNAGVLAASAIIPVTAPGLLKKAPGMLFSKNQPLFLRWSYLPTLLPFLRKYLSYANHNDLAWISKAIANLMHDTAEQHMALAKGTPAEKYLKPGDYVHYYDTRKDFDKDALAWKIRRENGFADEEMNADAIADYDPALEGEFGYGVKALNHGQITDPGAYTKALAQHFVDEGGAIEIATVSDILIEADKAVGVQTDKGRVDADNVVLASGVWSRELAEKLGLKVPMESERGYHLEFVNPNIQLTAPSMVTSGKFVMNSMEGRLRSAGIVEFGGLNASPSRAPFELLKRKTLELLPELQYDTINEWMGHRPSTTDSLPLIGAIANVPNVWAGFGHQHLGLTGAPKTGRWLAQLISGSKPNVDMAPYSPDRF